MLVHESGDIEIFAEGFRKCQGVVEASGRPTQEDDGSDQDLADYRPPRTATTLRNAFFRPPSYSSPILFRYSVANVIPAAIVDISKCQLLQHLPLLSGSLT